MNSSNSSYSYNKPTYKYNSRDESNRKVGGQIDHIHIQEKKYK